MIKCLCKENVQDRITGEHYVAGKEYDFTEERAKEVTNTRYFDYVDEVTEEVVQAVAIAIVKQAEEDNKNIEEVVNEIVEEQKPKRTRRSNKKVKED